MHLIFLKKAFKSVLSCQVRETPRFDLKVDGAICLFFLVNYCHEPSTDPLLRMFFLHFRFVTS